MALSNLTQALLDKLARGIASTKVLAANGEVALSTLDFSNAGQIFSIEDSLSIDWPEPTINSVKVDQGQQTIAIDVEKGDITFSANYPTIAEEALAEFFESGKECVVTSSAGQTYTGTSIFTSAKTTEVSLLIEDENKDFALVFARVSLTARLAYDTENKIWYIGLNGQVLANLKDGEGDVLIAPKTKA